MEGGGGGRGARDHKETVSADFSIGRWVRSLAMPVPFPPPVIGVSDRAGEDRDVPILVRSVADSHVAVAWKS